MLRGNNVEKEPHWASNKRLFLFNQFVPNGILMFPDFHPKMWLPNWLKPVKEQLRVEFPCTSTEMTCLWVYVLLLWTEILRKKKKKTYKSGLTFAHQHPSVLETERVTSLPLCLQCLFKKGPHTVAGQAFAAVDAHWQQRVYTARGNEAKPAHSQKWQEPFSSPLSLSKNVRTSEPLTDGDSDDKLRVCSGLWSIQINIHSFSIAGCKALTRGGGGGTTGSLSWLLPGVGRGYTQDRTVVQHTATQWGKQHAHLGTVQGSCSA